MGQLEAKISSLGGKTVGYWPADGYSHTDSKAIRGSQFCGLALDDDNEFEKSGERIEIWCIQLKPLFNL